MKALLMAENETAERLTYRRGEQREGGSMAAGFSAEDVVLREAVE